MSLRPENMDVAWNLVALGFSISGSLCTALGLIFIKLANIDIEKPEKQG